MNKLLSLLALFALAVTSKAAPPVVSNVTAAQRAGTKLVDIYYNVSDADGDAQNIQVQVSADGGLTYTIPCVTLSGHVGAGVTPGTGRYIVWNAGADWNGQFVPSTKVRITAYDGSTPAPPAGMAYIPAGSFQMGDNLDGDTSAMPVHNVNVDAFFMDRFECSREMWLAVQTWSVGHGYDLGGANNAGNGHPVQAVTWYAAAKWCNARSEKEGLTPCYYTDDSQTLVYKTGNVNIFNAQVNWTANGYRLPTEAEWEKAARGGTLGARYPWGDAITGSQANYSGSGDPFEPNTVDTAPVGYYNGNQVPTGVDMANGYSLYDMAGNVMEWCWDWSDLTYYSNTSANDNPRGPTSGSNRISRGGAWDTGTINLRNARRDGNPPTFNFNNRIGVRCVRGL
ncbi:MAG TPA: hypothetical protein DDZ88_23360 [Verrucomicrobiales bacterium]|nr:hypothetical protein [Verrucomicrobiales bacterium]